MLLNLPQFCSKAFFYKKAYIFLKVEYKKVQYFKLAHGHKPKLFDLFLFLFVFCCPDPNISFLALFFPFSQPLNSHYLLLFISFLSVIKRVGLKYKWSVVMGAWSIIGIMGHFTTIFAPKTDRVFSNLLCQNAVLLISKMDSCEDGSILALLSAYQTYLVTL